MMAIVFGTAGCFLLFFLYDINDAVWKVKPMQRIFSIGCVLLTIITAGVLWSKRTLVHFFSLHFIVGILVFVIFLIVLIYTLFFALPFEATYGDHVEEKTRRQVCKKGVYALCRHPGVLWMSVMYAGLFIALPCWQVFQLFCTATIGNILYVCFQDIWTFPKIFYKYDTYQQETPFLIPTLRSIRLCMEGLKKGQVEK